MKHRSLLWVLTAVLVLVPGISWASLTGMWDMTANLTLSGEELPCSYTGVATITDTAGALTGSVDLDTLLSGPTSCIPPPFTATLAGTATGSDISGTLSSMTLGTSSFKGTIGTSGDELSGTTGLDDNIRIPHSGSWTAMRVAVMPTLSSWALALLALILFLGSAVFLSRRRAGETR